MIKKALVECTIETERGGSFRLTATTGNIKAVDGFEKVIAAALAEEYSAFCTSTAEVDKLRKAERELGEAQRTISDLRDEVKALEGTVEKYKAGSDPKPGVHVYGPGAPADAAALPRAEPAPAVAVQREISKRKGK